MAGARKSDQTRSVQRERSRRSRYRTRKAGFIKTLPVVVIACDDEVTAPNYFNELKREYKDMVTIQVLPKPHSHAGPDTVAECAVQKLGDLNRNNDTNDRQAAWALIDLEHTPRDRRAASDAKRNGEKKGIKVALSNPCFEVWTLLHLEDIGKAFANCDAVIAKIKAKWKAKYDEDFVKEKADYLKIMSFRKDAAKRAREHRTRNDPSWTEVYKVIEQIEAWASQPDP